MKPLVFASYAQFGVNAGDEDIGHLIKAYEISTHYLRRPTLVGNYEVG